MNVGNKIKEFLGKLSSKSKKLICVGLFLIVAFSVGAALILNNKPYETLFTGLNDQEASEIITKLQSEGVEYKYEAGGSILVPKERAESLKVKFVLEGYPKSGFTYDEFKNNVDIMSTDSEKKTYELFDLQNRIASTIRLFEGVKDAKVTIVLGNDQKYVLDSSNKADSSASVVVVMNDGGSPTPEQVKGIQRLVAKSIPQLNKIENVVVLDGNGVDVTVDEDTSQAGANKAKLDLEKKIEDEIKAKVSNVLNPIYGAENIRVSVKSTVDMNKKVRETLNYLPGNEPDNLGIPSDTKQQQELIRNGEDVGGIPGVDPNADINTYANVTPNGNETYIRNQNDINYLVDQIKEQSQIDAGTLTDLTISVAINSNDLGSVTQNDLKTLIAKAAGIATVDQNDKIAVVNVPFYNQPQPDLPQPTDNNNNNLILIAAIAAVVLLVLAAIIIILVVRRKKKKNKKAAKPPVPVRNNIDDYEPPVEPAIDTGMVDIGNERALQLREDIREFSDKNPEIAAQLIKTWLRGGDADGSE